MALNAFVGFTRWPTLLRSLDLSTCRLGTTFSPGLVAPGKIGDGQVAPLGKKMPSCTQTTTDGRRPADKATAHNACSEYAAYNRHHAHTPRAPHAAPDWACPQPPTHLPTHFCGHMQAGVSPRPPPNQKPFQRKILP